MKHTVQLAKEFDPSPSDGAKAYRMNSLDRYLSICDEVTLGLTRIADQRA